MKFSLIVAVAMLALAQGSHIRIAFTPETVLSYLDLIKDRMVVRLAEIMQKNNLTNQVYTFAQDSKTQLEPLTTNIKQQLEPLTTNIKQQLEPLTTNIKEQLKTAATHIREQIWPLGAKVHTEILSQIDNFENQVEAIVQQLTGLARAGDN